MSFIKGADTMLLACVGVNSYCVRSTMIGCASESILRLNNIAASLEELSARVEGKMGQLLVHNRTRAIKHLARCYGFIYKVIDTDIPYNLFKKVGVRRS